MLLRPAGPPDTYPPPRDYRPVPDREADSYPYVDNGRFKQTNKPRDKDEVYVFSQGKFLF